MSNALRYIVPFSAPLPADRDARALLGGKGAGLAEMTRAGLAVPPGFTVTTDACAAYFESNRAWPAGLRDELRAAIADLERATGRRFGVGPQPLLVSVRSGAALSMPGMMDTLLNCGLSPELAASVDDAPWFWALYQQFVRSFARIVHALDHDALPDAPSTGAGTLELIAAFATRTGSAFPTEPYAALEACVTAVFNSWQSERAQAYRRRHDIRGLAGTAVNVQQMFPSEISGVAFTQDPTDLAANCLVIEGSYGLGESVVSGEVTPDRFVVHRDTLAIAESHIGHKAAIVAAFGLQQARDADAPSLTPPQVVALAQLAMGVEKHFGHPVDIEWGFAGERFALLQSRAIRGLEVARQVEPLRQAEIARLRAQANGSRRVWIAHNLGETLRTPTPMTWDIIRHFMSGNGGFGRLYQLLGYRPAARVCAEGFLELIAGRIYADPDRLAELFWESMPVRYDAAELAADKSLLDRAPARFDAARADGRFLLKLPGNLLAMFRTARRTRKLMSTAKARFDNDALPPFLEYVRKERAVNLTALSDRDLLQLLDDRRTRVLDGFGPESLLPGFLAGMALANLESTLTQILGPDDGAALARTLTQALEGDVTFEQDSLLHQIAARHTSIDSFLDRFGHRTVGEMELSIPRWREDPSYLTQTIQRLGSGGHGFTPEEIHGRAAERRREAERSLPKALEQAGGSSFRERIEHDLALSRDLLPYRENGKFYLMMGYALLRDCLEEFARRHDLGRRVYFLQLDELAEYPARRAQLDPQIDQRQTCWQALQRLDMADVIDSADLDRLGLPNALDPTQDELSGTAIAPGVATGPVRIVHDPAAAGDLGHGYVLVCTSTDPGWTPLFMNAAALIVERGGVLSHGAIVARDFGIPAVVCPNATRALTDGQLIKVDGNRGRILLQKEAAHA